MQQNKRKEKYEPPCLEEVLVPEDGGIANNCGTWRGVWPQNSCSCACDNTGNPIN